MSRIGKQPITLPAGVSIVTDADGQTTVTGPKGVLVRTLNPDMLVQVEGSTAVVTRPTDSDAWFDAYALGEHGHRCIRRLCKGS